MTFFICLAYLVILTYRGPNNDPVGPHYLTTVLDFKIG